jgi:hypothetical protein
MCNKFLLSSGELFTLLGTSLLLAKFWYWISLDRLTGTVSRIFGGTQRRFSIRDNLCQWIVEEMQEGMRIGQQEIEKEMIRRRNMLK